MQETFPCFLLVILYIESLDTMLFCTISQLISVQKGVKTYR